MKTLEDYNKKIKEAYDKYTDLLQAKQDFLKSSENSYLNKYIKVLFENNGYFIMYVNNVTYDNDDNSHCLKGPKLYLSGNLYDKDAVFYPEDWPDVKIEVITKEEYLELFRKTMINIVMELQ